MRLTLIILVLLAVGVPAVGAALVTDDPVFSKTVTVDLKGEALSDAARALSKAAEVNIRASKDVEDQKVTILVDKMPLRDVMNGLATLFGWSWTVQTVDDRDTYIIYDPLRKKREADRKEALDRAWQALGAKLDSLPCNEGGNAGFYKDLALQQYKSLSSELRKQYLSGMRLCYNTMTQSLGWRVSPAVMNEFARAEGRMEKPTFKGDGDWAPWEGDPTKPSNVIVELYSAVGTNIIIARSDVSVFYDHPDPGKGGAGMTICSTVSSRSDESEEAGVSPSEGGFDLCIQKIDYPSEALENALPDKPEDDLLNKKISISVAELVAEGGVTDERTGTCSATRADMLVALHKKLGVQIISDYYSSWGAFIDLQDITIKQIIDEELPGFSTRCGWDGNVLYARVKDVRTADSREIPNRFLRPWQAVVKKQGCRGLEELAEAALLSGEQRRAISENCLYLKLGECKEIDDIGGRETPLLRFYGLLTPKQKKDLFVGGIGVIGLTAEQRNALAALVYTSNPLSVGVYNSSGINMSQPQVVRGSSGDPVTLVQMTCSGSFIYMKSGDDLESRVIKLTVATTPEEALLMAKNQLGSDIDPQNVVATDDSIYTLAVRYEGYTDPKDEPVPEFEGSTGRSKHSSYHRVKIKVPDKKKR